MTTWRLLKLEHGSWAPERIFAEPEMQEAVVGRGAGATARLGDLVELVFAESALTEGKPVATPGDVSAATGVIADARAASLGVGYQLGRGLAEGDVLVPLVGSGPCVLVTRGHLGLAFSTEFAAIRPRAPQASSMLLWALLSSQSGTAARAQLQRKAAVPRLSKRDLLDLAVVLPPLAAGERVGALVPEPVVNGSVTTALLSRWRGLPLAQSQDWSPRRLLDAHEEGTVAAVRELGSVRAGRVNVRGFAEQPFPDAVPAFRPADVGRLVVPRSWTQASRAELTTSQSVLIAQTTLRVAIPPVGVAFAAGVLAFDARPTAELSAASVRKRLAAYWTSSEGQQLLRQQLSGVTVQRLTKSAFAKVLVPLPELLSDPSPATDTLLATRLEGALWS